MAGDVGKNLEGGGLPHPGYTYSPRYWRKRVNKNGNSLHVNIPHPICTDTHLAHGTEVLVYLVGRVICIQPAALEPFWPEVERVRAAGAGSGEQKGGAHGEGRENARGDRPIHTQG